MPSNVTSLGSKGERLRETPYIEIVYNVFMNAGKMNGCKHQTGDDDGFNGLRGLI